MSYFEMYKLNGYLSNFCHPFSKDHNFTDWALPNISIPSRREVTFPFQFIFLGGASIFLKGTAKPVLHTMIPVVC